MLITTLAMLYILVVLFELQYYKPGIRSKAGRNQILMIQTIRNPVLCLTNLHYLISNQNTMIIDLDTRSSNTYDFYYFQVFY